MPAESVRVWRPQKKARSLRGCQVELSEQDGFAGTHLVNALLEALAELEEKHRKLEMKLLVLIDDLRNEHVIEG